MAYSLASRNLAVKFFPSGENLSQRTFAQQIAANLAEWFTRIENVPIRVDTRKHGGKALEIAETQERLDGARCSINGLNVLPAPVDNLPDQLEITRIFDQAKIGQLFVECGLRRKDETLLPGPIQNALDFGDVPFFDHRADGDRSRMGHARFGQRDILHH